MTSTETSGWAIPTCVAVITAAAVGGVLFNVSGYLWLEGSDIHPLPTIAVTGILVVVGVAGAAIWRSSRPTLARSGVAIALAGAVVGLTFLGIML